MRNCIVVELIDGSVRAFAYLDERAAAGWCDECRREWNAGRSVMFDLPRRAHGPLVSRFDPDEVAGLELTSRDDVRARSIECREAVTFG